MSDETGHHRINERLNTYWDMLRGSRAMPAEGDVAIEDIKDIWPSCFLITLKDKKFSYSYLGDQLVEAYGDDITGKEITEKLVYPHPPSLVKTFNEVMRTGEPKTDDSEFVNSRGATVKYRSCVLPLAGVDGNSVAFLLGGMKWKAF
jgi:hypothetical protein